MTDYQLNSIKSFGKIFQLQMFISAINTAFKNGKLSITQRRGIIKLIPKKTGYNVLFEKLATNHAA